MYRKLIAPSVQHLIHNKYILRTFYHFFDKLLNELNLVVNIKIECFLWCFIRTMNVHVASISEKNCIQC